MKIIRPIDLTAGGVVESTALTENYVSWLQGGQGILGALAARDIPSDEVSTAADSSKTVFRTGAGNDYQLFLYDSSTDEVEDITLKLAGFASILYGFEISRDGNYIVAATRISEASDDYIITLNTSTWQLRSFVCAHRKFAILPDSSGVVFPVSRAGAEVDYTLISLSTGNSLWTKKVFLSGTDYDDPEVFASNDSQRLIIQDSVYYAFSNPDNYFGLISFDIATEAHTYKELADVPASRASSSYFKVSPTNDAVALMYWSPVDQSTRFVLWRSSNLTELWAPKDVGGYPGDWRTIAWALDGAEFTIGSSLSPDIHRVSSADGSLLPVPAFDTGGGSAYVGCYVDKYIVITVAGLDAPFFIDTTTGTLAEYVQPSFKEGDRVIFRNHVFGALYDNNDRPDLGATASPATWLDLGFINPLRMTDGKVGSFTQATSPLVIEVSSSELIDGVAMFGLSAASVQVELLDGQSLLFDSGEQSLRDSSMINGWYAHFFARRGVKKDYVFTSLPPYRGATLRVTLTGAEETVQIGELVAGQVRKLGDLLFGSRFGIEDWSRKERNVFGHWEVVERGYSKRGDYQVSVRTNQVSWIQQLLAGLRATPVVYIGSESQQLSIIYGFFVILDLVVEKPVYSQCKIEVEGLTDDSATN